MKERDVNLRAGKIHTKSTVWGGKNFGVIEVEIAPADLIDPAKGLRFGLYEQVNGEWVHRASFEWRGAPENTVNPSIEFPSNLLPGATIGLRARSITDMQVTLVFEESDVPRTAQ